MSNFQIINIISPDILKVSPEWKFTLKAGTSVSGDLIQIRGLDQSPKSSATITPNDVIKRLEKLLLESNKDVSFTAPELVYLDNSNTPTVSCSVYVGKSNILYYFPEFVYKD